jgi:hypothetical protein
MSVGRLLATPPSMYSPAFSITGGKIPGSEADARIQVLSLPRECGVAVQVLRSTDTQV